jgi:hypothetical protein
MILTPEQKKVVKDLATEVSGSMTRQEAERDFIKEAVARVAEEQELDKKLLGKLCKLYHKQMFNTEVADMDTLETVYMEVFELNKED